eukprot:gene22315-12956_t
MLSKVCYLVLGWCFASSSLVVAEERANFQVTCGGNVRVEPPPGGAVEIGRMKLHTNGTIESEQMTSMSEQMNAVIAKNEALTAEVAALKDDKASLGGNLDALAGTVATMMGDVKNLTVAAAVSAEAEEARNSAPSNVVYHFGGDLDFTPGSASLAYLEKSLVGVTFLLSEITIKGTDIQGSVVSRLLKDVATIRGKLYCRFNQASFADGDSELVFGSLTSVAAIWMSKCGSIKQPFTAASFPALTFVHGDVHLHGDGLHGMLKTISMPNLVRVGGEADFSNQPALVSLQLPSLVTVCGNFQINTNPSLATDKVQVSQDFDSVGGMFYASTMKDGFQCTAENGLSAAVARAASASSSNVDTCNHDLDFTPGSASLARLEKTLVGVTVISRPIYIKGTNIQGSVVSRLLKDVTMIFGVLNSNNNRASFEVGDSELVFESLASVERIYMDNNNDESQQRFTGASFPALMFVPMNVQLTNNPMLKTISMPNLAGVGHNAYFNNNPALTSLQLPRLVTVGDQFAIDTNPSLTTDKVQVSQDFESVGDNQFRAYSMMPGFQCTPENGLSAVVGKASTFAQNNIATCKK